MVYTGHLTLTTFLAACYLDSADNYLKSSSSGFGNALSNNTGNAVAGAASAVSFSMADLSGDEIQQMILDAKASADEYLLPTIDKEYLPKSLFQYFSDEDLRLAINEVYARHGRQYKSEDLRAYFSSKSWYQGTITADAFSESVFNAYEKSNIDMMAAIQNARKGGGGSTQASPAGTYAYQITEIAGGQTEYSESPNYLVTENGDGTLSVESRSESFILFPDGNGQWSAAMPEGLVYLTGNRLILEYGDCADIYVKQ